MKVLFAIHHFPPRYTGGAEQCCYSTAVRLQARGHDVRVVCVESIDAPTGRLVWADDVYGGIPVQRLSFDLAKAPDRFRWEYDNPWIGDHLHASLSEQRPDILHLVSGYLLGARPLLVARALGIATVVTLTDYWFLCPRITLWRSDGTLSGLPIDAATCARCLGEQRRRFRWLGRIAPDVMRAFWRRRGTDIGRIEARAAFLRRALQQADAIISPSEFLRALFVTAGVDPQRLHFERQGMADVPAEQRAKVPGSVLRIGYLGQIAEHKGVHVLLEAARRLRGVPLSIRVFGDLSRSPAYAAALRRRIKGDERVQLAGDYPHADVCRVLQEVDVVVVPSLWYENSPTVILEAFANRTPVVASNLGGMVELVRDGENGLLFAPGDPESLARQLRRLVSEPTLLATLRSGIGVMRGLDQEIDALEQIYQRVVRPDHREMSRPCPPLP